MAFVLVVAFILVFILIFILIFSHATVKKCPFPPGHRNVLDPPRDAQSGNATVKTIQLSKSHRYEHVLICRQEAQHLKIRMLPSTLVYSTEVLYCTVPLLFIQPVDTVSCPISTHADWLVADRMADPSGGWLNVSHVCLF
jgi:hypothetical protein